MTGSTAHSYRRHQVPTHLDVEDRAFLGLSVRQVLLLTCAAAGAYGLSQLGTALPLWLRVALAAVCFVLLAALVLVRPGGRGLLDWAVVALGYAAGTRRSVWRLVPPAVPGNYSQILPTPAGGEWVEWAPAPCWLARPVGRRSGVRREPVPARSRRRVAHERGAWR